MAILQALLALITKSAGKILDAIFGWAVHALFGRTSAPDRTLLSALVDEAAAPAGSQRERALRGQRQLLDFASQPTKETRWAHSREHAI